MRRLFTVLTAAFVAFTFSSMVFAQAAATTEKKPAATAEKAPAAAKTAPKAAAPKSATGKVAKFDEATKTVTVGEKDYTLAADAKIMSGTKEVKPADLAGKHVKVTYTVVDGKNVASKVTVAATPKPAAEKAPKTEKPVEKK